MPPSFFSSLISCPTDQQTLSALFLKKYIPFSPVLQAALCSKPVSPVTYIHAPCLQQSVLHTIARGVLSCSAHEPRRLSIPTRAEVTVACTTLSLLCRHILFLPLSPSFPFHRLQAQGPCSFCDVHLLFPPPEPLFPRWSRGSPLHCIQLFAECHLLKRAFPEHLI